MPKAKKEASPENLSLFLITNHEKSYLICG